MHERRREIAKKLYQRRYDTISSLAKEFGVSQRTIRRDINALSTTEPISTQTGKCQGGVYILEGKYLERAYMTEKELAVLKQLYLMSIKQCECVLDPEQHRILQQIILDYTIPKII